MPDELPFGELLGRVRSGDQAAAEALVRHYEPAIRRVVRLRLRQSALRRRFDSLDICQSVLGSFFVRAALGRYQLNTPDDLVKLLAVMARNKVADQARKPQLPGAGPRTDGSLEGVCGREPSPSRVAIARDLLAQVRGRLTEEERYLADLRGQGRTWPEITAELGGNADVLRIKLARGLDRVSREIGLEG